MEYTKMIDFNGDPEKALGLARATLTQAGFIFEDNSETGFTAKGARGMVRSQSGSPLYGASPVRIAIDNHQLIVEAGFEGARSMRKLLMYLLVILGLSLGIVLGVVFHLVFDEVWPVYLGVGLGVGVPIIQLPIHALVVPRLLKRRAAHGLDTLMHNMSMIG